MGVIRRPIGRPWLLAAPLGLEGVVTTALVPVLEGLMLADSDAWQLFEPVSKAKYRNSTLATFVEVRRAIGG